MKKAWTDLKSFITVVVMLLFAYCILLKIQVPEELKSCLNIVIGFFLGSKIKKEE